MWYRPPQFLYTHLFDDFSRVWDARPNSRTVDRSPREIVEGKKLEFDQHIKIPLGTVGDFFIPPTKRASSSHEDREVKKNEERTATGIVIGRNFDAMGTLDIYNIDSGTRVNRCKLIRQLHALAPPNEVVEKDLILPVERLTNSTRKATAKDRQLKPPDPTDVTDADDRRGEDNDASEIPVVEVQTIPSKEGEAPVSTDTVEQPAPTTASTDNSSKDATPTETIENDESNNDKLESNDSSITGVNDNIELTSHTSPSHNTSTIDVTDYPRRPGKRKLPPSHITRQQEPPSAPSPCPPTRARRQSKAPERFSNMAIETIVLHSQF